jgi:hypothetical protein
LDEQRVIAYCQRKAHEAEQRVIDNSPIITVDMTVLMAFSSITVDQTKAMENTMAQCTQLLDYLSGHADTKVRFHASDMILNIHSGASYLLEAKARSRACGHFFHGVDAT